MVLSRVGQTRVPTTEEEKDELFEAGLGEKDLPIVILLQGLSPSGP